MLRTKPYRKSTFTNLDRIRCSVEEVSKYTPMQRLTREFFWKCIHNTFRVGDFWTHIDTLEMRERCNVCNIPESLEHTALECDAQGQQLIWNLTQQLWSWKYNNWPTLSWG
ncbi:hypothetical protein C8J57DRAFT_1090633 [Mycena rebaudengoi]|nr:hypothetical protein C8J57DRAFT_1090633 [Mycena rebaudengoi]